MDTVRPWIIKQIKEGPLAHYERIESNPTASPLPLESFRGQKVQFIKFLSVHEWGTYRPIWAEASDRHVTILVYLSTEIVRKFEIDQLADQRSLAQLGFPTFSLGSCKWSICNLNKLPFIKNYLSSKKKNSAFFNQICIQVVDDSSIKKFKFGSTAAFPYPNWDSNSPPFNNNNLYPFHYALNDHPIWILLNKRLQVTLDSRLLINETNSSSKPNEEALHQESNSSSSAAQIAIPHTGPTRRGRAKRERMMIQKQSMMIAQKPIHHPLPKATNYNDEMAPKRARKGPIKNTFKRQQIGSDTLQSGSDTRQPEPSEHLDHDDAHMMRSITEISRSNSPLTNELIPLNTEMNDPIPPTSLSERINTIEGDGNIEGSSRDKSGADPPSIIEDNASDGRDKRDETNVDEMEMDRLNDPSESTHLSAQLSGPFIIKFSHPLASYSNLSLPNHPSTTTPVNLLPDPFILKIHHRHNNLLKYFHQWPVLTHPFHLG